MDVSNEILIINATTPEINLRINLQIFIECFIIILIILKFVEDDTSVCHCYFIVV